VVLEDREGGREDQQPYPTQAKTAGVSQQEDKKKKEGPRKEEKKKKKGKNDRSRSLYH